MTFLENKEITLIFFLFFDIFFFLVYFFSSILNVIRWCCWFVFFFTSSFSLRKSDNFPLVFYERFCSSTGKIKHGKMNIIRNQSHQNSINSSCSPDNKAKKLLFIKNFLDTISYWFEFIRICGNEPHHFDILIEILEFLIVHSLIISNQIFKHFWDRNLDKVTKKKV